MEKLGMNEIREKYLSFFESKGHLRLPSFSLVPKNDKSLLLINAGMAPLKPYFTGKEMPPSKRVTTCQKCIRTPDIDRVGKTARHGTFFEMLGNFSFGDYFKKEAIPWAWEFVTKVLELPEDRLWVTIYENDDEAYEIWNKIVGLPPEKIVRMGKEDNFWEIGTGPCGPCSEIYFDRGEDKGCGKPTCGVGCDCDRFIEFWNLVFTQFDKDAEGNYNPLPKPNIDTGMGLERIATIMQEVDSIFDVDVIRGITDYVGEIAGVKYGDDKKNDVSLRVITDHIRGVTFMISDGILPSNEGRGYVLRRLLRRAARYGKLLGLDRPFLYNVVDVVVEHYKGAYPEIQERKDYIKSVIKKEEERFKETIDQGLEILDGYINDLKASGENVLDGIKAFKLYDTYGFPIELTKEILNESGMSVDEDGYQKELEKQRLRARNSRKEDNALWEKDIYSTMKDIETKFIGYDVLKSDAKVLAIIKDNEIVDSAEAGEEVNIILDTTPFYAESGGQVGDSGVIKNEDVYINIKDCKKAGGNKFIHIGTVERGILNVGDTVEAIIDEKSRMSTARNHTATHLLHSALRKFIGDHVHQAGSLVTPERLRFDFTHYQGLTFDEIEMIEDEVNKKIYEGIDVSVDIMSQDEAIKKGAMALFQEKYGDMVRVVNISDYSKELCGGTHVTNTIQVGAFKIIAESGVAAGVRRIEAVTGLGALEFLNKKGELISNIEQILKVNEKDIVNRIADLSQTIKDLERQLEQLKSKVVISMSDKLINSAEDISGVKFVSAILNDLDVDELKMMGDILKDKFKSAVIIFATTKDQKINFVGMATKDAVERGINVGNIIKEICRVADGKGGGRADMAQGVGNNLEKINIAIEASRSLIVEKLQ
ncbi:alanine--tRNA ligase [Thermoanaerobacterium saccharolyticum]|uniref:alanine--tRNA ligase n=1 Tax=Thermoanaerobacterium saccharolyticum TaxID=28896 RepID=UPI002FDAFBE9